ncbi:MAG: sel1 repeat family protein [Proteobacteria bacterium]|nr:sel1 repeat family protein [Pseudomonadota bacterium]
MNYPEAEKWLRKAAEQGNADGEYFLGMAYSFGNGVEIDFKKALELYRKAAAQGDTRAMSSVAEAYGSGNGVERDVQEELRWFRKACSAGSKNACGLLESITPETGNLRCFEENR